ncbi:unnamed protein product [Prorocentrum cordatum]|uniref:Uncharacterized protein n=1 Tax=Prorocentrum cordatum TaxID=2364126 RepID=A0ABN9WNW6_9DINO|nr:unnamed protein product [Polarella glacialis]
MEHAMTSAEESVSLPSAAFQFSDYASFPNQEQIRARSTWGSENYQKMKFDSNGWAVEDGLGDVDSDRYWCMDEDERICSASFPQTREDHAYEFVGSEQLAGEEQLHFI